LYASEICIRKVQSFQRSDFDAEILNFETTDKGESQSITAITEMPMGANTALACNAQRER
jgi:hypothetical protein